MMELGSDSLAAGRLSVVIDELGECRAPLERVIHVASHLGVL